MFLQFHTLSSKYFDLKPSLIVRTGRNMISNQTSFKTLVVVANFLFKFNFSQFVKSQSHVPLISYTIQQIIRFKTKFS